MDPPKVINAANNDVFSVKINVLDWYDIEARRLPPK